MQVVAQGVEIPKEIEPDIKTLLQGLLVKDRTERCKVSRFRRGSPECPWRCRARYQPKRLNRRGRGA